MRKGYYEVTLIYTYKVDKLMTFCYQRMGELTRFTDYRDPKPRSRPLFTFHRPETFERWSREDATLRKRVFDIPAFQVDRAKKAHSLKNKSE